VDGNQFFSGKGEVRILHISGVCTGQIPLIFRDGWCLCSPSIPGSVLVLLFKMVIWVYNIMLPHEGEIVLIYLPRLHSGSLQRFPRPLSWWVGGSMPLHKVSWNLALGLSVLAKFPNWHPKVQNSVDLSLDGRNFFHNSLIIIRNVPDTLLLLFILLCWPRIIIHVKQCRDISVCSDVFTVRILNIFISPKLVVQYIHDKARTKLT